MSRRQTRRGFLKQSACAATTLIVAPSVARTFAANEKLTFAMVGIGGRAGAGIGTALKENLVAVAEVDLNNRGKKSLANIKKSAPGVKAYSDFRKMFDAHKNLEAVWVGTPDHNHFPASIRAMEQGAGVYCEKPLTHDIWEARKLREVAEKKKIPTQMGNQGHSGDSIRLIVEYCRSGLLGDITHVDCTTNRRFSASDKRPATKPVPAGLDWEAWLGPAPYRDFHDGLHPFNWRGYLDFGTGSLGDMACHNVDGPVWALKLYDVEEFEVEPLEGKATKEGWPPSATIKYSFPARGKMPPVTITWRNGGQNPPRPPMLDEKTKVTNGGSYFYGTKAGMYSGSHCQGTKVFPEKYAREIGTPPEMVKRVSGGHSGDWIRSCKDRSGPRASSHFGYSAGLTEIVLIGNVAVLCGEKLKYSRKTGKTTSARANALLKREPRKGWEFGYD